jgi:predicted CoA-binding protein
MLDDLAIANIVKEARTIAVYGMQDEKKSDRPAYQIPAMLYDRGYKIYPVNPLIVFSLGLKAYPKLSDLPRQPDILDVFRRSELIPELVDEILALPVEKRPKTVWLQTGITHPPSEDRLEREGIQVVSDQCLGVWAARFRKPFIDP